VVSSVISRVERMSILSYISVKSCIACFVSSGFRSLCIFVCFHSALRLSARAMSTV
jgi:hypothetical protein